ncbi:DUF2336 domain-containing protein [Maricaulaceae bacterium MS644]
MAEDFRPAEPAPPPPPASGRARARLTRRLADIVCLPASRVSPQERWMTADVLDELLREADPALRAKVAARLAEQTEAPAGLLRKLAMDAYEIAEPILRSSDSLTDFDMMEIAAKGELRHRLALARRESVSETVAAALCRAGDPDTIAAVLRNPGARLATQTADFLVREAAENEQIAKLLIKRPELRPVQAFVLFWATPHSLRRLILDRFAASRTILQEAAADVFPLAAREREPDPTVTEALAYIDRRQRDREAAEVSPYGSLEAVVERAGKVGFTEVLRAEGCVMANIQRDLFNRIIDDFGGEPCAVLAKATGLSRYHLEDMIASSHGTDAVVRLQQAKAVFETLSTDKAQTVLRYWNWVIARGRD